MDDNILKKKGTLCLSMKEFVKYMLKMFLKCRIY